MFYKGWVPTVNGRLSYKLIGETRYPSEPEYANSADNSHLYVAVRQTRQLSDVLFEPLVGPLFGLTGKFDFIFLGRARRAPSSPDSKLIGKVYIFRAASYKKQSELIGFQQAVYQLRNIDNLGTSGIYRSVYVELSERLESAADIVINVVLNRNGIVTISDINWKDSELKENSEKHSQTIQYDGNHGIADQVYFFVRDLTHHHQHHGNDADTIITTQVLRKKNEMGWSLEILYSLYYHVISIKRKENPSDHVRALGVIAYINSYKKIIERHCNEVGSRLRIPEFNDEAAKESIKATKDYIELKVGERRRNSETTRTFFIWLVATFITIINFTSSFADKNIKPNGNMEAIANFIKGNAYIIPILAGFLLIYYVSSLIVRPKYDFKRDVVRISLVNRQLSAVILLFIGVLLLCLCAYFVYPLLTN